MKPVRNSVNKNRNTFEPNRISDVSDVSDVSKITNGCGGKKGTKCGVEVYHLPEDSKPHKITDI